MMGQHLQDLSPQPQVVHNVVLCPLNASATTATTPPGLSDSPAVREASLQARGDGAAISPRCPSSPACVALELFQRLRRSDFPGK